MHSSGGGDIQQAVVQIIVEVTGVSIGYDDLIELQTFRHVCGSDDHTLLETAAVKAQQLQLRITILQSLMEFLCLRLGFGNDAKGRIAAVLPLMDQRENGLQLLGIVPAGMELRLLPAKRVISMVER